MAAIQPFVEAAESRGRGPRLRRAQLGVVSSTLGTFMGMPEHLRNVVAGIVKEIEDRCFRPVLAAPDMDAAMGQARASFLIFAELWPAALSAVAPWLLEDAERLAAASYTLTDTWTSDEALGVLGEAAASWFAAAQDARAAVAHTVVKDGMLSPSATDDEIVRLCVVADFAILLGLFWVQHPRSEAVEGLAIAIGKLGHESAKRAYVLATAHRFADPEPVAAGS
jgi:hypothetical protein